MLEEREREYKEGLIERFAGRLPSGERVETVAICQAGGVPPWAQVAPIASGTIIVAVSLFAGGVPIWIGALGVILVAAGGVLTMVTSRRLLARTNRAVHVFALPRSQKAAFEKPIGTFELGGLPAYEGGSFELGGETLRPNYGSTNERDALFEVLGRPS